MLFRAAVTDSSERLGLFEQDPFLAEIVVEAGAIPTEQAGIPVDEREQVSVTDSC